MLEQFLQRSMNRLSSNGRMGFDWVSIIMPIVIGLIQSCLENRNKLAGFVEGRRTMMQVASLKMNCRRAARSAGVGPFRAIGVGDEIAAAILAECDSTARDGLMGSDGSDPYQAVLDEINSVS
jgi:hypothetical protein